MDMKAIAGAKKVESVVQLTLTTLFQVGILTTRALQDPVHFDIEGSSR